MSCGDQKNFLLAYSLFSLLFIFYIERNNNKEQGRGRKNFYHSWVINKRRHHQKIESKFHRTFTSPPGLPKTGIKSCESCLSSENMIKNGRIKKI
jgi:hypothetical protein